MDTRNLAVVRQSFANTVFTHKVQEIAAEIQQQKSFVVKIINIGLVLLILILLSLEAAHPGNTLLSYIAVGVTIAEIIFLIVQLYFSFEQRMVLHKNAALRYMGLRDKYRSLITDIMNDGISSEMLISTRDQLQREYQIISDLAPQTNGNEYTLAQKRLNRRGAVEGEEFTWSDEEIDWFLPENLRLK